jgi:hypothetical protein
VLYLTVIVGCGVLVGTFVAFRGLRPCGAEYGTLVRCRVLVGRRGHRFHVWEPLPLGPVMRSWVGDLYDRNLRAMLAEERLALSVMNPAAVVVGVVT